MSSGRWTPPWIGVLALVLVQEAPGAQGGDGAPAAYVSRRASTPTGATKETELAALEGLRWLLRHQNADGSWGASTFASHCTGEKCGRAGAADERGDDVALTALALLAFHGRSLTLQSKEVFEDPVTKEEHAIADVVKRGIDWLLARQREDGGFGEPDVDGPLYRDALATLALCEAYGMTNVGPLKDPAGRAVDHLIAAEWRDGEGRRSGWRYAATNAPGATQPDTDFSATAWAVLALRTAQSSGLETPAGVLEGGLAHSKLEGLTFYPSNERGFALAVPALSSFVRTFAAHDAGDPFLKGTTARLGAAHPAVAKGKGSMDYLYWHFATLVLWQLDGRASPRLGATKHWETWNKALVSALLALQEKGLADCSRGAWLAEDYWSARNGDALYATALNVLTLETYYRYPNVFAKVR